MKIEKSSSVLSYKEVEMYSPKNSIPFAVYFDEPNARCSKRMRTVLFHHSIPTHNICGVNEVSQAIFSNPQT